MDYKRLIAHTLCPTFFLTLLPANAFAEQGSPEITSVMELDELAVANQPGVEKLYKYLREPNAVVTEDGVLIVVAGPHHVQGKNDRAHQDVRCWARKIPESYRNQEYPPHGGAQASGSCGFRDEAPRESHRGWCLRRQTTQKTACQVYPSLASNGYRD